MRLLSEDLSGGRGVIARLIVAGAMIAMVGTSLCPGSLALAQNAATVSQASTSPKPNDTTIPGAAVRPGSPAPQPGAIESEKDRLAVNPVTGLAVLSVGHFVPLTGAERWKLYWKQNYFSEGAYFGPILASLLLDQATNSPREWGGGFAGYGRRLASRTGSAIVQGTVQAGVAAVLHEDVRFVPSEEESSGRRAWHAIKYTFLTYTQEGRPTPNIPNIGAYFAATAISTTWQPHDGSAARYTLTNSAAQIALAAAVNVFQEFWPDLTHRTKHRH
jgi:hypothetical protein